MRFPVVTVLLLVLGFFAGLLGSLTGIGGGVLLTHILALHFDIPIRQAIGTSLVAVITTSAASSSVHLQRGGYPWWGPHGVALAARQIMSQLREPAFDRIVALVLRTGAFGCFFIMLAGLIVSLFVGGRVPLEIERAGVLLMLATPVVRVVVACYLFFHEKDYRYGWISLGVLVILMLGAVFGIGEH